MSLTVRFVSVEVTKDCQAVRYGVPIGESLPAAWRVGISDTPYSSDMEFARRKDAEAAQRALEAAGLDTLEKLAKTGRDIYTRIMVEALAW